MKIQAIAPTRISLFGGGSDIAPYSTRYGGMCINMAISLRTKVTMYSDNDIFELPNNIFPPNADPSLFYTIFKKYKIDGNHLTRIKSEFDGRVAAGLGSSASACVALIGAINKRKLLGMSKKHIAQAAWNAEERLMRWHGGKQDQWAAIYGGFNALFFKKDVIRTEISQSFAKEIHKYLLLFDTGGSRNSYVLQRGLVKLTDEKIKKLHILVLLAKRAFKAIMNQEMEEMGKILDVNWEIKKQSNTGITNEHIDSIYTIARHAGATGGKLLGAGGCGYMAFWVPPLHQDAVIHRLEQEGCDHVIYYPDTKGLEVKEI